MFRDAQQELQRLEEELLEEDTEDCYEEEWEEEMEQTRQFVCPADAYNTDNADGDLEEYSQQVYEEPEKHSYTGLLVAVALLSAGVLLMLVWCMLHYWEVL